MGFVVPVVFLYVHPVVSLFVCHGKLVRDWGVGDEEVYDVFSCLLYISDGERTQREGFLQVRKLEEKFAS